MLGIDILSVEKIKKKNNKFFKKIFTDGELIHALKKGNYFQSLAGIYAAKEAVIKAYQLPLTYIIKNEIEIRYLDKKPIVFCKGQYLTKDISISHDSNFAVAICNSYDAPYQVDSYFKSIFPKRAKKSHKGDYGRIAFMGGSIGMSGSIYLSSMASLRTGAGIVYIICPKSIGKILQIKSTEQIILPINAASFTYKEEYMDHICSYIEDKDILAIGPGMGQDESLNLLISSVLDKFSGKIIIDADGLNAISYNTDILKSAGKVVLTPHLKEFERLTSLSIDDINKDRIYYAKNFAEKYGVILVLKSDETIVTDGFNLYVNNIGNPGMATAGSGDVLTGIIASLLHRMDPYEASCLGVYIHSLSGDLASYELGEDSIIASDIIKKIPAAMKLLR